uniref:Ribosomal RNA-processing protein 14/surfeit locus protein 6 C-terminal domain-containing protein n=1 Tax=Strigamia maritima TaxID=126957 RepID=T1IM52_STRMM
MAVGDSMDDSVNLKSLITGENDYIKNLVDTIAPQYYFQAETCDQVIAKYHERAFDVTKRLKKRKKKNCSVSNPYKRMKLNPDDQLTVTQMQKELAEADLNEEQMERVNFTNEETDRKMLLKKLHSKVESLKGNRKDSLEWRLKQKEKRRLSKLRFKEKKKAQKKNNKVSKESGSENTDLEKEETKPKCTKPFFNDGKSMVFSKFDFSETGIKERKKKMPGSKDYKQLLQKIEKNQSKVKELEEKNPEKASLVKEKETWMKVMQKAEGIKIKDNPEQLKKALKKKELRAKKSKKNWDSREEQVKEKIEKRQQKRTDNIKAKRDAKVKKKVKRAMKKGRYIPV